MWYVYILKCERDNYYVGITNNVERRFEDHKRGAGAGFTRKNKPLAIVYREAFTTGSLAKKREQQLKRWSRAKKKALIAGDIAKLRGLSTSHD